jgi:hypothetical protein
MTLDLEPGYDLVVCRDVVRCVEASLAALARDNEVSLCWREITTAQRALWDMRSVGKEVWRGVDAAQYVRELRDEWER